MKVTVEQNNYLCSLRDSGSINMFGAVPYLQRRFGLTQREARDILLNWMQGGKHDYIREEDNDESE